MLRCSRSSSPIRLTVLRSDERHRTLNAYQQRAPSALFPRHPRQSYLAPRLGASRVVLRTATFWKIMPKAMVPCHEG